MPIMNLSHIDPPKLDQNKKFEPEYEYEYEVAMLMWSRMLDELQSKKKFCEIYIFVLAFFRCLFAY